MRRDQLEHVLRASAGVTDQTEFVVVGSQSILGSVAEPPPELVVSLEADIYPRAAPERSDLIDGAIGDGSPFHETFGYYAHGVGEETALAPEGWQARLVRFENANTNGAVGWCMEPHDLVLAKLVAGREKDVEYARVAIEHALVDPNVLLDRCSTLPVGEEHRDLVAGLVLGLM